MLFSLSPRSLVLTALQSVQCPMSLIIATLSLVLLTFSAPSMSQQDRASYKLGAGDHIIIKVFDEADLSMDFSLNESGILNYPLLGELKIAGLTIVELEQLITSGLKGDYLISPDVTISIEEYRPIYIVGEVKRPGSFPYQPALTVKKAIALAGGYTERAARNRFSIVRANDSAQTTRGIRGNEAVKPGDVITVSRSFF